MLMIVGSWKSFLVERSVKIAPKVRVERKIGWVDIDSVLSLGMLSASLSTKELETLRILCTLKELV